FEAGIFWGSRLEFNKEKGTYHINNVIGPDEYKEHINDDAFTNHMARWCMENAIHYYDQILQKDAATFKRLNSKLNLKAEMGILEGLLNKIHRPQPDQDSIIPQNDSYMKKKIIDLSKYKNQEQVATIFKDYSIDQINEIQVTKQASVVMLLYLLEHKFTQDIKLANFHFYEARTLHDSSLSLSTHAVLASDVDEPDLAYRLFRNASEIDLGPNMKSSDEGIHAASLGGIWQIVACGFGGLRMVGGKLRIDPSLPDQVKSVTYPVRWKGTPLEVNVSDGSVSVSNNGIETVEITVQGKEYSVKPGRWIQITTSSTGNTL
ncbi:MAG: glycoside hydrolase family 65 protein, partial [Bacteroidales bacterium]|nr:glycoside hydrolase family 65 protein [Bacteroidales bacterium]